MKSDIEIRKLQPEDGSRLVEIALAAWAPVFASFRKILGAELFDLMYPDWQKEKADQIVNACQQDAPGTVLVAQSGGAIVGFVSFYPNIPRASMAEIGNNAVHPDFQSQGIAQMMYQEVFQRLRTEGIKYVTVRTGGDPSHLPARIAYERVGFNINLPGVEYFYRL